MNFIACLFSRASHNPFALLEKLFSRYRENGVFKREMNMTTKWTWLRLANLFLSYLILYYGKWCGAEIRFQFFPGKK